MTFATPTPTTVFRRTQDHEAFAQRQATTPTPTRTNLGPLTTRDPRADNYSDCHVVYDQCGTCSLGWQAQTCVGSGIVTDRAGCWPAPTAGVATPSGALNGWGVYSPGIVCPFGFESVAAATEQRTGFAFQYPLTSGEKAVACCPTPGSLSGRFTATIENGHQTCKLVATTGVVSIANCEASGPSGTMEMSLPFDGQDVTLTEYSIYAPLVQVVWRDSDIAPGSTAPNGDIGAGAIPTGADNNSNNNSSGSSGLSTGAQIAIGVSAGVVVLALLLAGYWIWRKKQRRQRALATPSAATGAAWAAGGPHNGPGAFSPAPGAGEAAKHQYYDPADGLSTTKMYTGHGAGAGAGGNTELAVLAQLDDDRGYAQGNRYNDGYSQQQGQDNRWRSPAELAS
ncbi:uncharacterized protein B0I36DRAFT_380356 [Microdochium trichocladiopsis]|uniref:Uncharacterized protein n=1 Tax=Microdochium trichocladiopsis TaxID=1682393 RepID=A0A9P8YFN7_9PEZI|nr:uncharacterized protein B0I36DRAFT_380356 [Microdochium trichocladiopsis]KAH7037058.1 hypothetical protein B0I36DRAFT_380356 [Microdochium trichocladiopsis]